jgi:hypothetical protein
MADDIDQLIKWASSQGWEVRTDSSGYRRFYRPDGTYVGYYPATPSNRRRRFRDIVTVLRTNGLQWPPASKKEQRAQRRRDVQ